MSLRFRPTMEPLDDRTLPSTTIVDGEQFTLTGEQGTAEVTLTVVEDAPGYYGFYHWRYVVENVSYGDPSANPAWMEFSVSAGDVSGVENLQSSLGWEGMIWSDPDGSDRIIWDMGDHAPLRVGQTAEFSFLTAPMPIGTGGGTLVDDDPMGDSAYGEVLAPAKGVKLDFANATTGKAYKIHIVFLNRNLASKVQIDATIGANATTTEIAEAVKNALEGAGCTVVQDGTKLTIGAFKDGDFVSDRVKLYARKLDGTPDNTINGPSFIYSWGEYLAYFNDVKLNP